jgi:HSP20 family protein
MLTIRRNPFSELAAMERNVDRIFSEVFARPANGKVNEPAFFRLPVNVELKDGKYVLTAPLAGFKPEEVDVSLADGLLTISAKHSEEKKTERDGYVRQEVVSGNFYRQIPVGQIDPNSVSADVENGVLTVTLPAPTEPQPVKIAINPASSRNAQESGSAEPAAKSA